MVVTQFQKLSLIVLVSGMSMFTLIYIYCQLYLPEKVCARNDNSSRNENVVVKVKKLSEGTEVEDDNVKADRVEDRVEESKVEDGKVEHIAEEPEVEEDKLGGAKVEENKVEGYKVYENKVDEDKMENNFEEDNTRRLKTIQEVCATHNIKERLHKSSSYRNSSCTTDDCTLFYRKFYNFFYCHIPKIGCSTFKSDILQLFGVKEPKEKIHQKSKWVLPKMSPNYLSKSERSKFIKFMFVRHPFERLGSTYSDKVILNPHKQIVDLYWTPLLKKYRGVENVKNMRPTFKEFVNYVIDNPIETYDEHWQPYWYRCAPCTVRYDFIGEMKTFSRDKKYIYDKIGISEKLEDKWFNNQNSSEYIPKLYSTITKLELIKLYEIYYLDFILYNYTLAPYDSYVKL